MSGHLRFCFAAFVLAGLPTSPASSNPFADFFNAAPRQATAPAPAETSQATSRASELTVVDAASVLVTGAAALMPPAPIAVATDQLTPDHPTPRQVDVETLLAAAPAASDAVAASVPPAAPVASP